ncbi:MAG TPA: CcmD family protein [Acidobacteriota bacterium]|nr:CcmD family protein [Acidobacteriota bacterium]HRR25450.1 CcmD family protein [Acidobacteriota bacterium]HRR56417.1 CcmD family protein [Acidobacteriota bacterium]HRV08213.1 CcmD family protein [Acidobacteriota bacterium]
MTWNWYLFAGYTVIWVLIALYLLYLHREQRRTTERLEAVEQRLARDLGKEHREG